MYCSPELSLSDIGVDNNEILIAKYIILMTYLISITQETRSPCLCFILTLEVADVILLPCNHFWSLL